MEGISFVERATLMEGITFVEVLLPIRTFLVIIMEGSLFGETLSVFMVVEAIFFLEIWLSFLTFFVLIVMVITFFVIVMEGTFFSWATRE